MAETVYSLCATLSLVCAAILLWGFRSSGARLLFWSGLCFIGLALNNILLLVDLVIVPQADLQTLRTLVALLALGVLVFGLVWESL